MKSKNIIIVCMVITIAMLFGITMYSFVDKNTISTKENRTLAKKTEFTSKGWFNGSFEQGFEAYLNDHVYERDNIIDVASSLEQLMKVNQDVEINLSNGDRKDIGTDVVILKDRIIPLYIYDEKYYKTSVQAIDSVFAMIPDGIDKYIMLSPSRCEFEEEEYRQYCDSQRDAIAQVYAHVAKDVTPIDAYSSVALACQTNDLNDIFFRTDHHWTQYGSMFGANALLCGLGKLPVTEMNVPKLGEAKFYGYLYAMHEDAAKNIEPDDFYYYDFNTDLYEDVYGVEGADVSEGIHELMVDGARGGYYTYIERSYMYSVIDGGNKDGGVLMMINDSYGNALVPWIANQFEKVILLDPRTFNGGKKEFLRIIKEEKVDKFMINIATMSLCSGFGGKTADLCK